MKTAFAIFVLALAAWCPRLRAEDPAHEKKPFELYAQFLKETQVELSDGAVWLMDKGDCFPVYMFKDQQTKIVLKMASSTFQTDSANLKVLPESENENALASYRKNLADYLNKQPDIWKEQAKKKKGSPPPEKK